ncbi:MAG: VOC family protein [Candidatus Nitronauta litoralis]|uniref:VOC family protein n=1 Tax=Candidatus Nitronauta litoralis TaxID=2705533 RepID=A0A7T0G1C4_9BACT|nr:MAG: VOC family protein [Candidatus Nitronauta litoralis]
MEQRISIITLGVKDIKKAQAFYDALGWKVASEDQAEQIVAYDLSGMTLALYPLEKLVEEAKVNVQSSGYSTITIAYNVRSDSEVDAVLKEAVTAGGKLVKPAEKVFWGGYSGYFADPDGNLWEVAHNPFSKLGPNGEFQWKGVG